MVLLSYQLVISALALASLTLTESRLLLINYMYPNSNNYSQIELHCVYHDDNMTAAVGAGFQLNGTDIREVIDEVEVISDNGLLFNLTQEQEGFVTCSLNGSLSNNTLGFAAQPTTDYSKESVIHGVESDAHSIELQCDIQPGALIQRYSVVWMQVLQNASSVFGEGMFNISLNVSSISNGTQYQCNVTINHDGRFIKSYRGTNNIVVIISTNAEPAEANNIVIIITSIIASLTIIGTITYMLLLQIRKKIARRKKSLPRQKIEVPSIISISLPILSSDMHQSESRFDIQMTELNLAPLTTCGIEDFDTSDVGSTSTNEYYPDIRPYSSGDPIDPYNTVDYIPVWFSPIASLLECTYVGKHYYDQDNDFGLVIPEGAIPRGRYISIDIGVEERRPFQYPKGLRPVSPVFWVCVRDQALSQFLKPVKLTIPHFLDLDHTESIKSLGLTVLKADHKLNSQQLYDFKPVERETSFEPQKKFGVLQISHFCSLCIACKDTLKKAEFHINLQFDPEKQTIEFTGATQKLVFDLPMPHTAANTLRSDRMHYTTVLDIDNLFDVKAKLIPVAGKWKDIGLALGLKYHKMDTIEKNKCDIIDRLTDMLTLWLNKAYDVDRYGEPTRKILKDAVCHPAGGHNPALAETI